MSFFDSLPAPDLPDEGADEEFSPPPWHGPPSGVLGAVVPVSAVLARTGHVVVALTRLTAYPSGCVLSLDVVVRRGGWDRDRWQAVEGLFWGEGGGSTGVRPGDALRLGVELADGSRTSTGWWPHGEEPPTPPVLISCGGGGGSGGPRLLESARDVWLWPVPDGATLELVADWQALEVPESRVTLDAAQIRSAAASAAPYWPETVPDAR